MVIAEALTGTLLLLLGVVGLALCWRRRQPPKWHLRLAGWLGIAGGMAVYAHLWGAEAGIAYGSLALSVVAYAVVGAGIEFRAGPKRASREVALEPEERSTGWRRGIAKSLLAIVLSGIASIGVGVAIAVSMPMPAVDRIMLGGILVPVLWGAGMAWTLSDARLLRATILLTAVSAVSYGIAFLPKVVS
ncbi:MAG: hypothetical protein AB7G35_13070 [Hyphomicrobiaceae bacterium]